MDDKDNKSSSDILSYESRLKQKEDIISDLERETSYFRGKDYYKYQSYLLFQPKPSSFSRSGATISTCILTGIHNESNISLNAVANSSSVIPKLLNQNNRLLVNFSGNLLKQSRIVL